jgi:soluble lytic murein transglycosylase
MRWTFIFIAVVSLALVRESGADIYSFKDAQGTVHFTNVPARKDYRLLIRESKERQAETVEIGRGGFQDIILAASERFGVDADLIRAVIKVESDYNVLARSPKGAQGLMQLMPATAKLHDVVNVDDPLENIQGGARHLRLLLDRFGGDLRLTLAAYNAGIKAVEQHRGIPPFAETQQYVRRVLQFHDRYRRNGSPALQGRSSP